MNPKLFGKDKDLKKRLVILYATQTGMTEKFAKTLYSSARARNFEALVSKMDDFDYERKLAEERHVLFLLSTFYNGEFPDNGTRFWKYLSQTKFPDRYLQHLNYSVFGLGNSSFKDTFTRSARLLDKRLFNLGANKIIDPGFGDEYDKNGHESGFRPWTKRLWSAMNATEVKDLPTNFKIIPGEKSKSGFKLEPYVPEGFTKAKIINNEILTPDGYDRQINLITIDLKGTNMKYNISDKIVIQPMNCENLVKKAAKVLGIEETLDQEVEIKKNDVQYASVFPAKTTPRILLTSYLDIQSIPTRSFLEELSLIAKDKRHAVELENLATNLLNGNEFSKRCSTERFSIVDVLEQYNSVKLTFEQFITLVPLVFPRYYSICSSPLSNPDQLQIVYNIDKKFDGDKQFQGLATSYLSKLSKDALVSLKIYKGDLKIQDWNNPLLLVGLGTGLGGVRGVLQHMNELKKIGKLTIKHKSVLFVGVRHENKDFIFQNDFQDYEKNGLVEIIPAFSMDQSKFITVIDKMEEFPNKIQSVIKNDGQYIYCGLGGLIPRHIEQGVIHSVGLASGVSRVFANQVIKNMKNLGKWYEEGFSISLDDENEFKNIILKREGKSQDSISLPIYDQFSDSKMFCFQCEQTNQGKGCTTVGVCGKTPEVAGLQDLMIQYLKQLSWLAHELRKKGISDKETNRLSLAALFSTLTNVNFDPKRMIDFINDVRVQIKKLELICQDKGINLLNDSYPKEDYDLSKHLSNFNPNDQKLIDFLTKKGEDYGVLKRYFAVGNDSVVGLQEMLVYGIKGICAYADHALLQGKENEAIYAFIHEALSFLSSSESEDLNNVLEMLMKCGQANYITMQLLHEANTVYGFQTPHTVSTTPVEGKCILASGHDLKMLEELLKQADKKNVNIYTHGELLPAHGYPNLRKYKNLKGHFGGAWQKQSIDFPKFPGAIIMTTNCLTAPKPEYSDRLFTAGAVGWPGISHISEKTMDFSQAIEKAISLTGFTKENINEVDTKLNNIPVGFGHETVISVAGTVLEAIKSGDISRFYVIGGCDGFEGERSYYTEFAKNLPKTSVILTLGCGKYRINQLQYETIGKTGIPRLLDLGQCNDAYSAIQIALALKNAVGANSVNDLPISIVLSWFEQKAIAVLLSLLSLGIKNIHIGPQAPGFITPQVLQVLVEKFNLRLVGEPIQDINRILQPQHLH